MGTHDWFADSEQRRADFLNKEVGRDYISQPMTNDMAPRFYHRIIKGNQAYILMESAPDGHPQALVGHELDAFLKVQVLLKKNNVRVPDIYVAKKDLGLILLEDFGDLTLQKKVQSSDFENRKKLYQQAAELLLELQNIREDDLKVLPDFENSRIYSFGRRFVDWFLPYYLNRSVKDEEIIAYQDMMRNIKNSLPEIPYQFVHGDYQLPNLMILEDGHFGLLDFQGAMYGPAVYDLVNLVHDARRTVEEEIIQSCQKLYFSDEENVLSHWYSYLSLHFHLRCIGQFIRVAILSNKRHYLQHLDRLWGYLMQNTHPVFQVYCKDMEIDFSQPLPEIDLEVIQSVIRDDAT